MLKFKISGEIMKKLILGLLTALLINMSIFTYADEFENDIKTKGFYISSLGGVNLQHYDTINRVSRTNVNISPGFLVGGSLGYKFDNNIRLASEFTYGQNDITLRSREFHFVERQQVKGVERAYTIVINTYYDFDLNSKWAPYLGLGLGWTRTVTRFKGSNKNWNNDMVVSNVIAGLAYKMNCTADIGIEYRALFNQQKNYNHSIVLSGKQFF